MKRSWLFAPLAALLALIPMSWSAPPVRAASSFNAMAGNFIPNDKGVFINAMLPATVAIVVGDSVTWSFVGFHTVTFSDGAPPPAIIPDPNVPGGATVNPAIVFQSGGSVHTGKGFYNSGIAVDPSFPPYTLTFMTAGTYGYICEIHPAMGGTVTVLPSGTAPLTPAQVATAVNTQSQAIQAKGLVLANKTPTTAASGGNTTYTMWAGDGDGSASVIAFLPVALRIRVNDSVVWLSPDPNEPHTITFNLPPAPPPDPNAPPDLSFPPFIIGPAGGSSFNGQGLTNSGFIGFGGAGFPTRYQLKFTTAGTYDYLCVIHADLGMVGKIIVDPAVVSSTTSGPGGDVTSAANAAVLKALAGPGR